MFHEKDSIPKNTGIDIANTGIIPAAVLDFQCRIGNTTHSVLGGPSKVETIFWGTLTL
jgi:hypothetical protein